MAAVLFETWRGDLREVWFDTYFEASNYADHIKEHHDDLTVVVVEEDKKEVDDDLFSFLLFYLRY